MDSSPAALKAYARKVFDAVSCGSFNQRSIGAEFATKFTDPYPVSYWLVLQGWSECMSRKYDGPLRDDEKTKAMKDCLEQKESSRNTVEETWAILHLKKLIDDFEKKKLGEIRFTSRP
jgi:hypothetical protein